MEHREFIDAVAREGADLATAARAAGPDAAVPTCAGWTVADLVGHVGRVHRRTTALVAGAVEAPPRWSELPLPPAGELFEWFEDGLGDLEVTLTRTPPDAPALSWAGPPTTAEFWARRMAHETAVHRYDAQAATGAAEPIDPRLATDGIQEFFDVLPLRPGAAARVRGNGESIHFHCLDTDGEWVVRLTPDGIAVAREHAKADVAVRGHASDLLLLVWGRVPTSAIEVLGDASVLDRWRELTNF
jgi:uncharacterized protein (TIGR03083 family)